MIEKVTIEWKESAVKWHPGQTWISQNEFAVLDILINPISILGEILGFTLLEKAVVVRSKLWRPKNWKGPIAGSTALVVSADSNSRSCVDMTIQADYAWNYEGEDIWRMEFLATDDSTMELYDGGAQLAINGKRVTEAMTHDNILRPEFPNPNPTQRPNRSYVGNKESERTNNFYATIDQQQIIVLASSSTTSIL
jgi:hypothetical protein